MFIFNSSIGKKFIQAVSGAFLIIFLLLHVTINFFSVIDTFTGKWGVVAADEKLFSAGDGLFKLGCDFMSTPVISIMVPILALGFLIHIAYGCWLTAKNISARGGYKRYEVSSKAATDSWSARNMFVLGIVILGMIAFHLTHFWAKMQLPEMFGVGNFENNPYCLRKMVGAPSLHHLVCSGMVPPLPRILEHVPDSRLGRPDLVQEGQGDRHHRFQHHLPRIRRRCSKCIPAGQRSLLLLLENSSTLLNIW